ncbi:MAG: ATP-binding protein [Pseudomonadota bacterium]
MNALPTPEVNLDNCDREPIHIPGHIQPHGVLFAFDRNDRLTFRSVNANEMLGDAIPAPGETLAAHHFPGFDGFHELMAEVREAAEGDVIPHAMQFSSANGTFDVIAHRTPDGVMCEFENALHAVPVPPNFSFTSHRSTERLKRQQDIQGLLTVAVDEVRRMTGFDRVMAYRFRHDDSGEVVAESVDAALDPFIGRRYPASDIPVQARRLYIINTLRLIADVKSVPIPVEAAPHAGGPLDMSHGVLRSVSPVHIEYLTNMGVGASMSVSIVIGGKLWGMLACHHMQPRRPAYTVRMACDVLAQILASNLQGALSREHAGRADTAASLRASVVEQVLHADDVILALSSEAPTLCEVFGAHGVVVADGARLEVSGGLPQATAATLIQWLNEQQHAPGRLIHMNTLDGLPPTLLQQMDVWCGLLALPFGAESQSWLLLLRKEQLETVLWGGKPEKNYTTGPLGPRLTPRGSFDLWKEIVSGKAVPWDALDLDNAQKLLDKLSRADAAHMAEINRARNQLMAMLGHDLRDPLQSISNTATLLEKRGGDDRISQRLMSSSTRMQRLVSQVMDMSRMHSGSLTFQMREVDLAALFEQLIAETRAAHPGMEIMPRLPQHLFANVDADRMAQVLSNLLSNASHHGTAGEPVLVQLGEKNGIVTMEVSNSGAPIPDEMVPTLFQPFKRMTTQSPTNRNGLGLGLYIAHKVIAGHGGELSYTYADPYVVFSASFPARRTP